MRTIALYLALAGAADAQPCTQLQYVGAPFSSVVASSGNSAPVNNPLIGRLTLAEPLPANAANYMPTIVDWDYSTQYPDLKFASIGGAPWYGAETPSFTFTTVNGVITNWNSSLTYYLGPGTQTTYNIFITSTPSGDSVTVDNNFPSSPGGAATITGSSSAAGTWTCVVPMTASFVAPPVVPIVDPEIAIATAAQAAVVTLTSQLATAKAQLVAAQAATAAALGYVTTLTAEVNSVIAERNTAEASEKTLTARLTASTAAVTAANKTIVTLRAQIIALEKSRR